jgi:hypothetical protein
MNAHHKQVTLAELETEAGPIVEAAIFLPDLRVYQYKAQRVGDRVEVFDASIVPFADFWAEQEVAARYASPTELGH